MTRRISSKLRAVPYFMVRIRIPNGALAAHQLRTLADLAEGHARGVADLTVRQNVQLHWRPPSTRSSS